MKLDEIPIGPFNTGEFGSMETAAGVRMLYAIDVYQHVRQGVSYPGVLITAGQNDPRISDWMSGKLAAKLQGSTSGPRPVLLSVNPNSGHVTDVKDALARETADFYSFLLWQAGAPGFQPAP